MQSLLAHAVTAFDRKQSTKAHYNHYALGQYLIRVEQVIDDIGAGADPADAICAGFTKGPLRNACLKAIGIKADSRDLSGSYKGMPVYSPVAKKS